MSNDGLIELTADIVATHVAHNNVSIDDIAILIKKVHEGLASRRSLGRGTKQLETPIVSIRASVKPDHIICLKCGSKLKTLSLHLKTAHDMTPSQFREEYELPYSYPMICPEYRERRRAIAVLAGLGSRNARTGVRT